MLNIGIDKIAFHVPQYYFSLEDLAKARQVETSKYTEGLLQHKLAIAFPKEDLITMAASAAKKVLEGEDIEQIDLLLFATESGIDHSKAAGIYLQNLLQLPKKMRILEIKQACYSGTAAIYFAKQHLTLNPNKKALVICSDIAKYALESPAEATQGAGAVALLLSADAKLLALEDGNQYLTDDLMDFWRPSYAQVPFVDGALSIQTYLQFFESTYQAYLSENQKKLQDFSALCFHVPYGKLALKALRLALEKEENETLIEQLNNRFFKSIQYNQQVGNIYTGSLFLNFLSLLEHDPSLKTGDRIGFFSYGSGASAEFFSGTLVEGYKKRLLTSTHQSMMQERKALSLEQYENLWKGNTESVEALPPLVQPLSFEFLGIEDHKRRYLAKK